MLQNRAPYTSVWGVFCGYFTKNCAFLAVAIADSKKMRKFIERIDTFCVKACRVK